MNALPALPIILPLAGAILCILLRNSLIAQRVVAVATSAMLLGVSIALLVATRQNGYVVLHAGQWMAPFGITLVIDLLSGIMLFMAALMGLMVSVYASFDIDRARVRYGFFPLFLILLMGVNGAFATGDLFNLYVWFEVLLTASFILLSLGGERPQLEGAIKYVVLNLLASALFLAGVGILYGLAGTLNMADLARVVRANGHPELVTVVSMLFLVAFGIKSAMFPLFFWLPASYHTPPPAVSAIFSGLLTKVGVYALIRVFTLIFVHNPEFTHGLLLGAAALTMVSGVLGAAVQYDVRRILAFHIISQIGYMIMGLAVFTPLAIAGAIFYIAHNMLAKSNLFLIAGVVNRLQGSFHLDRLGGLYRVRPLVSILFLISAMALAGLPPLSGFFGKLVLVVAGLRAGEWLVVAAALAVSLMTLFSMTKIWAASYWKEATSAKDHVPPPGNWKPLLVPIIGICLCIVAMSVFIAPVFGLVHEAALQLLNPEGYIEAVLQRGGGEP